MAALPSCRMVLSYAGIGESFLFMNMTLAYSTAAPKPKAMPKSSSFVGICCNTPDTNTRPTSAMPTHKSFLPVSLSPSRGQASSSISGAK